MKNHKIYSFIASPVLWTKEDRLTKIEDIEKTPYYDELMFEINANADIEPFIEAKDNKFKTDDFKAKSNEFNKNKYNLERKIIKLENTLKRLENVEKQINHIYGEIQEILKFFPKEKKCYLKNLFSSYVENGLFLQNEIIKIKAKPKNFIKALFNSSRINKANEKLDNFISYCEKCNIFDVLHADPSGKARLIFDGIMNLEQISISTFFAEIMGQMDKTEKEIEATKEDIIKGENSIKLENQGYERDNYVLIDIENELIRKYAKQMREKLFPQTIKENIENDTIKKSDEIKDDLEQSLIDKNTFDNIKSSKLKVIKSKTNEYLSSIKNIFKKKSN